MCTVSLITTNDGFRMVHNRDEMRSRSAETEPEWKTLENGLRACWPTDPDGGGTWVGMREDGVVLGLLNFNPSPEQRAELEPRMGKVHRSRGVVIPQLLDLQSFAEIRSTAMENTYLGMKGFRLVMAGFDDESDSACFRSIHFDGVDIREECAWQPLKDPVCWASSGLGDELVQCRLPLFDEMMAGGDALEQQQAFHVHHWEDRPEFSVMMSRTDARTSSVTTIDGLRGKEPKIVYEPIAIGDEKCDPIGAGMLR